MAWFGLPPDITGGLPNGASGLLIDQAFYLLMIVGSWIVATSRGVKWNKLFAANTAIMLFYLYFGISILWSPYPLNSFIRVFKDFGATVFVISVILSEKDPLEALRAVYVRCACVAIPLSFFLIRYYGDLGRAYARNGDTMFTGVTTTKNAFGELLMISIVFLVWDHLETRPAGAKRLWSGMRWDHLVLLLMGAWLLHLSYSQTSFVCLCIGLALILRSGWLASRMINRVVLFVALSLPFLLLLTQQFSSIVAPILDALGRDTTFTGRTDIWKHITFTTVNPLVGCGFWNFWGGPGGKAIQAAMQTPVPNAHDGYLDIYLDGGLIGLVLLFCVLFTCGKRLIRNFHVNRYQRVRFAFLIVAILVNLTESNFARLGLVWFTTLLMLLEFPFLKTNETFAHEPQASSDGGVVEVAT
jgi:O-antigen ligase